MQILELVYIFAQSCAAPRAHRSWVKVSSCDLSSNFGAQGHEVRTFGLPRDGPFLFRIVIWYQVPLENLTVCFDRNIPGSRRIDFLG